MRIRNIETAIKTLLTSMKYIHLFLLSLIILGCAGCACRDPLAATTFSGVEFMRGYKADKEVEQLESSISKKKSLLRQLRLQKDIARLNREKEKLKQLEKEKAEAQ